MRGFAHGGDGVIWNKGAVSDAERALSLPVFELRAVRDDGDEDAGPTALREADVLRVAGAWSVDPTELEMREDIDVGLGYIATAPADWSTGGIERQAA